MTYRESVLPDTATVNALGLFVGVDSQGREAVYTSDIHGNVGQLAQRLRDLGHDIVALKNCDIDGRNLWHLT